MTAFTIALGKGFHLEPVKLPPSPRRMHRGTEGERRSAVRGWLSSSERQRRSLVPVNDPQPGSALRMGKQEIIFFSSPCGSSAELHREEKRQKSNPEEPWLPPRSRVSGRG